MKTKIYYPFLLETKFAMCQKIRIFIRQNQLTTTCMSCMSEYWMRFWCFNDFCILTVKRTRSNNCETNTNVSMVNGYNNNTIFFSDNSPYGYKKCNTHIINKLKIIRTNGNQ